MTRKLLFVALLLVAEYPAGAQSNPSDATVRASDHIGVLLGTRYVVLPRYIGDRLWTMPWAFGLRVRW